MLVYRIEDEEGTGAYALMNFPDWGEPGYPGSNDKHPGPDDDSKMRGPWIKLAPSQREHYFFGFASEDQLRAWFYDDAWLVSMDRKGLALSLYDVPDQLVIVGHTQLIFVRNEATKIESQSLMSLCADPELRQ